MAKTREPDDEPDGAQDEQPDSEPEDESAPDEGGHFGGRRRGPGPVKRAIPGKVTRSQAMNRLQCGRGKLERLVADGKIPPPHKDENGHWWYDAEAVEDLADDVHSDELGTKQLLTAANEIIRQQMTHHAELASVMARMIDETGKREAAFMGAFLASTREILEQQTQWTSGALARASQLESELDRAREAIDASLEHKAIRDQIAADGEARRARNERLMSEAMKYAPAALALVGRRMGAPAEAVIDPSIKALADSLSLEQMSRLMQSGILSQDQLGHMAAIWEVVKRERAEGAEVAEGGNGEVAKPAS